MASRSAACLTAEGRLRAVVGVVSAGARDRVVDRDVEAVAVGGRPGPGFGHLDGPAVLSDHPEDMDYRVIVRHGDPAARARHEELGFFEG